VWNVTDPARATRIAAFAGSSGFIEAVAFAPASDLLADVSTRGTVTLLSLPGTARPVRVATMPTLPAARLAVDFCGAGGCPAGAFTLGFAPDGRTLTAVVNFAAAAPSGPQAPTLAVRDFVFTWNVTRPRSVTRIAAFSHPAPDPVGGGNGGLPLLAPDGRTVVDGAPFGSFGISVWKLTNTDPAIRR